MSISSRVLSFVCSCVCVTCSLRHLAVLVTCEAKWRRTDSTRVGISPTDVYDASEEEEGAEDMTGGWGCVMLAWGVFEGEQLSQLGFQRPVGVTGR